MVMVDIWKHTAQSWKLYAHFEDDSFTEYTLTEGDIELIYDLYMALKEARVYEGRKRIYRNK